MAIDITGLTIKDILDMDIEEVEKMSRGDLAKIASRLVSASNKRVKRLSSSELGSLSPSYKNYVRRNKKFTVRGKDKKALLEEYKKNKIFLGRKTSTLTGMKQVQSEYMHQLSKFNPTFNWTKRRQKQMWDIVDQIRQQHPEMVNSKEVSNQYVDMIIDTYSNKTGRHKDKYFLDIIEEKLKQEDEEEKQQEEDYSEYFYTE